MYEGRPHLNVQRQVSWAEDDGVFLKLYKGASFFLTCDFKSILELTKISAPAKSSW